MSMHGVVQPYLIKQIIIPKRSQTGSEGAVELKFPLALQCSEGNHLVGHSVYVLHR